MLLSFFLIIRFDIIGLTILHYISWSWVGIVHSIGYPSLSSPMQTSPGPLLITGSCRHEFLTLVWSTLYVYKNYIVAYTYQLPRQHIKKQSYHFADKGPHSESYSFSSRHVQMWELDHKEGWALKNWCFLIVVLKKTFESPLDSRDIKPVNPKGNQPWRFIGRTDAEAAALILLPCDMKSWLIGKDPDAGKDWGREEEAAKDEMVGWYHWLNGHKSEQTLGDGEGQGSLACCSLWCGKELDTT